MRPECYARIGCGRCGIELNPWHVAQFQTHALETAGLKAVYNLRPKPLLDTLCPEFQPPQADTPSDPIIIDGKQCGTAGWWWNEACPETSAAAFGFMFHDGDNPFTIQHPYELTASQTRKARLKGCTLTGRRIVNFRIEAVGTNARSAQWLADQFAKRIMSGDNRCCGRNIEIFADCCDLDNKSGRRTLTDAAEFLIEPAHDVVPLTDCGVVLDVFFTAGDIVIEPDALIASTGDEPVEICLPTCPPTVTYVEQETLTAKEACPVEFTLNGGVVQACLTTCETFDPALQYAVPSGVAFSETDTTCCPVEIRRLDLYSAVPEIVAAQPSLFQTEILDKIGEGIDCACPPAINSVRVKNPIFDPTCENCPDDIRGAACANENGFSINNSGFLTGVPAGTYLWDPGTETTGDTDADRWLTYLLCVGASPTPAEVFDACPGGTITYTYECLNSLGLPPGSGETETWWATTGDGVGPFNTGVSCDDPQPASSVTIPPRVAVRVVIDSSGATCFESVSSVGGTFCDPAGLCQQYVLDAPGMNVSEGTTGDGVFGNSCPTSGTIGSLGPQPINPDTEAVINCQDGEVPANCLPWIDAQPSGSGPCVTLLMAADGSFDLAYDNGQLVDLAVDDIRNASFVWGPCAVTPTTEVCRPVIPSSAPFTVNIDDNTAAPVGWEVGAAWPYQTDASQYTISEITVDGVTYPNSNDPIVTITTVPVAASFDAGCEPACGTVRQRPPQIVDSCFECPDDDQMMIVRKVSVDPAATYRPVWSVTAASDLEAVQVWLVGRPAAATPPGADTTAAYLCNRDPVQIASMSTGDSVSLSGDCLTARCGGTSGDAFAGPVVPGPKPFGKPRICGNECVYLIVTYGCETAPPVVTFEAEAIADA